MYSVEQSEDSPQTIPVELPGKKVEKDLRPGTLKGDKDEPLSPYDPSGYARECERQLFTHWSAARTVWN